MRLLSLEVMKAKKNNRKNHKAIQSKKIEHRLLIELKEKLEELLTDNDRTLIEVDPKVTGEFINILSDKILTNYDFEQVDKNKFIFYAKEIDIY